ncbi:hypothetical protein FRB95_004561 [Tulasnella sp. JGI-2019a]|nr:hypothetical protein FRB93_012627 [Tulasnella sp. JGI-2019a]KAG9037715.1 hypothetical protein FRB95_004561 [Tulasnella sp. JGI-2019a]
MLAPAPHQSIHAVHRTPTTLLLWYWILIIGGQVLLPFLLCTMLLSRNVRRDPTLISMISSWIVFTVIMCLLYYGGYEAGGPEPPFGICLTQASRVYGAPVMSCTAGMGLVLQVFFGLRNLTQKMATRGKMTVEDERDFTRQNRWRTRGLVVLPYVLLALVAIVAAVVGARNPSAVTRERSFFFCSIESNLYQGVMALAGTMTAITVFFEAWIAFLFYRGRRQIALPRTRTTFNVRIILRVIFFSLFTALAWASHAISGTRLDVIPWMLTATIPVVGFMVFGTQKSILRVWAFWIPRKEKPENEKSSVYPSSDSKGICTLSYAIVQVSQPILITIPPQAYMNPCSAMVADLKMGIRENDSDSLNTSDSGSTFHGGETVKTFTPRIEVTSSVTVANTPEPRKDIYGWELGAVAAGLPTP